jgi:hypothetical protein
MVQRAGTCSRAASAYPATSDNSTSNPSTLTTTSCSKEDEDVLKAEYLKNPKPDKAARLEIVSKVALGEKEVQVRRHNLLHVTRARQTNLHLFSRSGFRVSSETCTLRCVFFDDSGRA